MTYTTGSINSATPAKDLMTALGTQLVAGGFTFVESFASANATGTWTAVTYGNSVFVAVATGTSSAATSSDGINWTVRNLPISTTWQAVTYGGSQFVAVGANFAATSSDGITWTQRSLPAVATTWGGVAYGGGVYVAISNASSNAVSSTDGITWTLRTLPVSQNWTGITYGGGLFVAVASGSAIAATSPDGITWTQRALPSAATWTAITTSGSVFVTVASGGSNAASSPDGITWTARSLPASATWSAVTYGGGLFVALASGATTAASSTDGINWTSRTDSNAVSWSGVAYGSSIFAAVANGTSSAQSSPDGITWTARTMTGTSASAWADVYKSPAASNIVGADWYLLLRRVNDTTTQVFYQVAESYSTGTHKASSIGGIGTSVTPVATTYVNPTTATVADSGTIYGASATLPVTTGTPFSYWTSINPNRAVIGIKTTAEFGAYLGLYDDLLPSGTTQFPLVAALMPTVQTATGALGAATGVGRGGFTREPLQALAVTSNFEACIHNGYWVSQGAAITGSGFTLMTTTQPLYGNATSVSRVILGSARTAANLPDAVRGLLIGCVCSSALSVIGDTITAGGKTYVRFGGPNTTYGIFVDQAL